MTIKFALSEQFASRPTLRDVTTTMLSAALREHYPDQDIDPGQACVTRLRPDEGEPLQTSLVDSVFEYFIRQATPQWTVTGYALSVRARGPSAVPLAVDMQVIGGIVDRLAQGLMGEFKQAIADFWSQPSSLGDAGVTRWAWLSGQIRQQLLLDIKTGFSNGADIQHKAIVERVAMLASETPTRTQAGVVYITLADDPIASRFALPALVVVDRQDELPTLLVYRLYGEFEHYSLQAWEALLHEDFAKHKGRVQWVLHEPPGNVFDGLAQAILESQFNTLNLFPRQADVATLERFFAAATDVAALFVAPPRTFTTSSLNAEQLPDWLRSAGEVDRIAYSRLMAALAALQARTQGKAFNEDLPSISQFTLLTLRKKMLEEHPDALDLPLAEVELVVEKVTAVAAGSGGQMTALGEVEEVRMSLLDFALENLVGLPVGKVMVRRTTGQGLPEWLTVDFVKQLVQAVDIGRVYPSLLRRSLVTESGEVEGRRQLFCDQLRVQLPLKALEQKLRGQGGLSTVGCRLVEALMPLRTVTEQAVVLRPLAFIASPGRQADTVTNMFVIGSAGMDTGPCVLYRPFCAVPLTEFSTEAALLAAIVQAGELQQSVLCWLSDHARAVYTEGGFNEPHITRFGLGSEFAPLAVPGPAVLCRATVNGDPLHALFNANALALVEIADRSAVSNVENRWATLKEGGWLLLNALLPILGDTLGNSLWLMQLFASVGRAIALPKDAAKSTRSAAMADLLLNIALVVLHQGFSLRGLTRHRPVTEQDLIDGGASGGAPTGVPTLDLSARHTELDFSWSNAFQALTEAQRDKLSAFEVVVEPSLGNVAQSGVHANLLPAQGNWYARVEDRLFRVDASEDGVVIVNPTDPATTGPWLARRERGWGFDVGLRLRGGGPKQNARKLAQANAENTQRINDRLAELQQRSSERVSRIRAYLEQLKTATGAVRQLFIERYESDLTELLDLVREHVKLAQELRPGDRPSEKDVATRIKAMARQICYFEELLLNDQQALVTRELAQMRALMPVDAVVPENAAAYFELFRKLTMIQVKGVRWASIREELWAQLREVPKVGEQHWREEVLDVYAHRHPSALEWEAVHMFSTLELVFSDPRIMFSDDLKLLRALRNDDNLHASIASHVEVDKPNNYSLADRISVVESALKEYEKAGDIATYIHSLDFAGVKGQYLEQFIVQIDGIRDAVLKKLATLIVESADASADQLEYLPKLARPGKRVIRTRGHRTLVGNVRQGETELDGDVVDVTDGLTSKIIQSWHQHADGDWVEVVEAGPEKAPAVTAAPVNTALLGELQAQAKVLLDRVEVSIQNAWRQSKRANEPADMEDILQHKADKLTELAAQMQPFYARGATLSTSVSSRLVTQLQDLPVAASRLRAQGREIRIAMIKAQPPTAGRISYLHQQQEINISSYNVRKNMSGARRNDFLQEFAIRDTGNKILWWAHFHYAAEDARADAYTAAHLKLPEQRFLGYKALIRDAKAGTDVVNIYRSSIGKDIAQRLFLTLTP